MRKVLFGLMMFLAVCTIASAEVNYTALMQSIDKNKNIIVVVEYDIDGEVVPSNYVCKDGAVYSARGEKLFEYENGILDGRSIQISAYSSKNFAGMTQEEKEAYVDERIQQHGEALIVEKFSAIDNSKVDLSGIMGVKKTVTTADIMVSETEKWTVDTAGNKTVTAIEKEATVTLDDKIDSLAEKVNALSTVETVEVAIEK